MFKVEGDWTQNTSSQTGRWMIHMCFQPLSPICLKACGCFPSTLSSFWLSCLANPSVTGFQDLSAPRLLAAELLFHSLPPLSSLPSTQFFSCNLLVLSVHLFHTVKSHPPIWLVWGSRSYNGTAANYIIVINTFWPDRRKRKCSWDHFGLKKFPILGFKWVSAVVATMRDPCCVVSSNKCLNICNVLFISF